jgi:hypothetical protein
VFSSKGVYAQKVKETYVMRWNNERTETVHTRIFSSLLEITLKVRTTKWNDKQTGKTTNTLDDIKMYKLN